MSGPKRLPPRLHPDDMEAIQEFLTKLVGELEARVDRQIHNLHDELERMRPSELLLPASAWRELEERISRLEDELRDLNRASIKTFLELDDVGDRCAEEVQELREELTG